jgi:hypothetical protein
MAYDALPVLVRFFFDHGSLRFITSGFAAFIYEGSYPLPVGWWKMVTMDAYTGTKVENRPGV